MCDYSLEAYRSRPAEEGEKLTLERFPSGSMGFTTGPACDLAVCVPAESHLLLQGIGDTVRESCGVGAVEEVVMTRLEPIALPVIPSAARDLHCGLKGPSLRLG